MSDKKFTSYTGRSSGAKTTPNINFYKHFAPNGAIFSPMGTSCL